MPTGGAELRPEAAMAGFEQSAQMYHLLPQPTQRTGPHRRLTECELFKFRKTGSGTELVKDVVIPLVIRLKEGQS